MLCRQIRKLYVLGLNQSKYGFYDLVLTGSHRPNLDRLPSGIDSTIEDNEIRLDGSILKKDGAANELTAEERIKKVFGGRIKGEDRVSSSRIMMGEPRIIAGVKVPDRPIEPDNCCMSGCINCVWEIYNDDIKDWEAKRKIAAKKLAEKGGVWPADFHPPVKFLKPENLPESFKDSPDVGKANDDAWNKVPVEMRVFAELEKKIKSKRTEIALV